MKIVTNRKRKRFNRRQIEPVSKNSELHQLHALFKRISDNAPTNKLFAKICKKLRTTRTQRHPVKTSQLVLQNPEKIQLVLAKVVDSDEIVVMPKINLICLKISQNAKKKIEMFGGKVHKLDEIFNIVDDYNKVEIVCGDPNNRKVCRYFGAPGDKEKPALEKVLCKRKNVLFRPS
ncbi:hypothetical protein EDEG_01551 [Edhazardia aedis USNM 41457]|uniref:Large ribosomal subunit protein uL15/eL18 domain-containing protein n=1 Tax=Edhazardia aedis (strain USNM 41457) TaxID=1003232 RepID=J9D8U5_EDHAE|nr:hypothetical protein EDEG_01551 [Edhazardia aedis USNM 41457]|eukprot:EJW04176.1 hypothetical protein EDEG_01551 [Edhazardia aedis USNM 41457]